MLINFFGSPSGSCKRTNRCFGDNALLFVIVFLVLVFWGSNVLVTGAPIGRVPGGAKTRSSSGGISKPCAEEEISRKAYLAQSVFEGKARSRSPVRDGVYNVTFVVQHVFKGAEPGFQRSQVRLQFAEKPVGANIKCNDEDSTSVVRANIRRGGKYIVFVDKIEQHIFKARGEPAKKNDKNLKVVKDALCCGKFLYHLLSKLYTCGNLYKKRAICVTVTYINVSHLSKLGLPTFYIEIKESRR
ncbi:hypothetical protein L9F63_002384 [Diploptera punctata]|uniref:Vein beta-barrel domain-containing protein n=1 Tax=Diploptera punctata TaxID=6984 RepID=A0AAD8EI29_DIPPU|nr:hypothetical protein L9F63_002384 [Diploptera punctata]